MLIIENFRHDPITELGRKSLEPLDPDHPEEAELHKDDPGPGEYWPLIGQCRSHD